MSARAKTQLYSHCPECGEPLEATVRVYLSNVVIDENGALISSSYAFGTSPAESMDEDNEALEVYCSNDHAFDFSTGTAETR